MRRWKRFSTSLVVNYGSDKAGKPIALSKDQLAQVESLTREAMGFSTVRGDTLNVVNTPFNATDDASGSNLPFWQQQSFFDRRRCFICYLFLSNQWAHQFAP